MKVTILQSNIVWGKPVENQKDAEDMLKAAESSDIYILPEMWTTGFATAPQDIAEDEAECLSNGSVQWMKRMAKELNGAVCGSLAIKKKDGRFANRLYFVEPNGCIATYDKRHLFVPGGEDRFFDKGKEKLIVTFRGMKIMLLTCYDLRFPVWSRNIDRYDAVVYVANWPSSRHDVWTILLKARAIENQCFAIGVNRVGADEQCKYNGESMIVNAYGQTIAQCGSEEESITAELDLDKLERFRKGFPVLDDSDEFTINNL